MSAWLSTMPEEGERKAAWHLRFGSMALRLGRFEPLEIPDAGFGAAHHMLAQNFSLFRVARDDNLAEAAMRHAML
jgi:hypothetical protein